MRTLSLFVAAWALPVIGIAQQPAAAAGTDKTPEASLAKWLRATAAAGPTAFEVHWQPPASTAGIAARAAQPGVEAAQGSYATDLLWVEMQGAEPKTWLQVGRHTLVRDKAPHGWRVAGGRARSGFVPDPVLLLHVLAAHQPEVASRAIAAADGGAVEQISLCLTPTQIDALEYAGAFLDPNPLLASLRSMAKAGRVKAEDVPTPFVDVCLDVDVATRLVRRIHVRTTVKEVDARQMLLQAQLAQRARAGAAAEPEGERATEAAVPAELPKEWKDGLPVRDVTGMQVVWIEFVLRDHGKAPAVVLDDTQKALLGR